MHAPLQECVPLLCQRNQSIYCACPEGREADFLGIRRASTILMSNLKGASVTTCRLGPAARFWLANEGRQICEAPQALLSFFSQIPFIADTVHKAEAVQVACAGERFHGMGSCGHHRCGGLGATPCSQRRELDVNSRVQEQALWRRGRPCLAGVCCSHGCTTLCAAQHACVHDTHHPPLHLPGEANA